MFEITSLWDYFSLIDNKDGVSIDDNSWQSFFPGPEDILNFLHDLIHLHLLIHYRIRLLGNPPLRLLRTPLPIPLQRVVLHLAELVSELSQQHCHILVVVQ